MLIYQIAFTYISTEERMPSYEWTQLAYWKTPHLSYNVFVAISILGGIIGIDHLYLRSPITAVLKIASFFVLPFFWYLYDILQITAEKNLFMTFGLTTPIITTSGIGAGMFKDPREPVKNPPSEAEMPPSPLWFIGFFFLSFLPFGFDHFIVGDNNGGLVKLLLLLIPGIGLIYTIGWTLFSLFRLFFKTETLFSYGISRFVTPKMEEFFFAGGRLGMAAAKPEAPKKKTFMDLLKEIWGAIKKFFSGGDDKNKELETHGFLDAAIQEGKTFVKEKIIAKSPLAQKALAGVEMAGQIATTVADATVKPAKETAEAVSSLIATAPAQGAEAAGILQAGLTKKLGSLPSPIEIAKQKASGLAPSSPLNSDPGNPIVKQSGGGIVSDNSTAILALIAMIAVVASFSLGKYMFVKFHGSKDEKAHSEKPPTRSDYSEMREGLSDMPPEESKKDVVAATSVSATAAA